MNPSRPGPIIFAPHRAEKTLEAETLVREPDRPVRIAFARRNRVAQPGDQHVAHRDFGHHALSGAIGQQNVDAGERRAAIGDAQLHLFLAARHDFPRRPAAVVELQAQPLFAGMVPASTTPMRGRAAPDNPPAFRPGRRSPGACRPDRRKAARPYRAPSRGRRFRGRGGPRPPARRRRGRRPHGAGNRPRCETGESGSSPPTRCVDRRSCDWASAAGAVHKASNRAVRLRTKNFGMAAQKCE